MITNEMLDAPCNWNRVLTAAAPNGIGDCGNLYLSLKDHRYIGTDKDLCPMCGRRLGAVSHNDLAPSEVAKLRQNPLPWAVWEHARLLRKRAEYARPELVKNTNNVPLGFSAADDKQGKKND